MPPKQKQSCILRLRRDNIMNAQDEDFVFVCLLGAYIQSLCQQEGQQQLQCGKARGEGQDPLGMRMVIRRQKAAARPLLNIAHKRALHRRCQCLTELSEDASKALPRDPGKNNTSHREKRHKAAFCPTTQTEAVND